MSSRQSWALVGVVAAMMLASLAPAEEDAPRISMDIRGATLGSQLELLRLAYGVEYTIAAELEDRAVNVRLEDVTPEEALQAIVKASGLTATRDDGVWKVVLPDGAVAGVAAESETPPSVPQGLEDGTRYFTVRHTEWVQKFSWYEIPDAVPDVVAPEDSVIYLAHLSFTDLARHRLTSGLTDNLRLTELTKARSKTAHDSDAFALVAQGDIAFTWSDATAPQGEFLYVIPESHSDLPALMGAGSYVRYLGSRAGTVTGFHVSTTTGEILIVNYHYRTQGAGVRVCGFTASSMGGLSRVDFLVRGRHVTAWPLTRLRVGFVVPKERAVEPSGIVWGSRYWVPVHRDSSAVSGEDGQAGVREE